MGLMFRALPEVRPPSHTFPNQPQNMNVATPNPCEWQHCLSQSNAGDKEHNVRTPNGPEKGPPQQQRKPPGTEVIHPILVDLDNTSNQSGDNIAAVEQRRRTPESQLGRVHNQPRLRVVPCAKKLLGVAASAASGDTRADASPSPTLFTPRYKDPPGYSDARDFGATEEPTYKPPLLQPKNHGVSEFLPGRSHSKGVRVCCFLRCADNSPFVLVCGLS